MSQSVVAQRGARRVAYDYPGRIPDDDRFRSNKEEVTVHLRGHPLATVEPCQDLIDRINENGGIPLNFNIAADTYSAEFVVVTPERAEQWLTKNTHNRNSRQRVIDGYAIDMAAGNWKDNGAAIVFAKDGTRYPVLGGHLPVVPVLAD